MGRYQVYVRDDGIDSNAEPTYWPTDVTYGPADLVAEVLRMAKCGYTIDIDKTWRGGDIYMMPKAGDNSQDAVEYFRLAYGVDEAAKAAASPMYCYDNVVRVEYGIDGDVDYMRAAVYDPAAGASAELYAEIRTIDDEDASYSTLVEAILDRADELNVDTSGLSFHYDEPDMEYTVHDVIPVSGAASSHVIARMAESYMANTGRPVYVSWHRRRDGQDAFLTQQGDHVLERSMWVPPVRGVTCVKQIVSAGNSLALNLTTELKSLGLSRGDEVKVTLERTISTMMSLEEAKKYHKTAREPTGNQHERGFKPPRNLFEVVNPAGHRVRAADTFNKARQNLKKGDRIRCIDTGEFVDYR